MVSALLMGEGSRAERESGVQEGRPCKRCPYSSATRGNIEVDLKIQ
jgi:organic hydroperoxide reductase OsmC/OhrA